MATDESFLATNPARQALLLVAMCLAAIAIRPPLTVVGPLADMIGQQSGLPATAIAGLTTLPLIVFVVASPLVARLAQRLVPSRLLMAGFALMAVGSLVRWQPSLFALYAGTALIAIGIAAGNVLLPAIARQYFPHRLGGVTSLYATLMTLAGGMGSAIAVPLAAGASLGWQATIALPGLLALAALLAWLPLQGAQRWQTPSAQAPIYNVWRSGLAWCVAIFFGLQGMLFYSLIAWMAPMLTDAGLATETAGLVVGGFGIVGTVSSVLVPMLATRRPNQTMLAVGLGLGQLGCALGLFFASGLVAAVFAIVFGLFSTGAFTLCFILFAVRAPTSSVSTALSGMAQSVGYALAAAGPMVLGIAFDMTASWSSAGLAIIAMALGTTCFGFVVGSKVIAAR